MNNVHDLKFCGTNDMIGDALTKILGRLKFLQLRTLLGLSDVADHDVVPSKALKLARLARRLLMMMRMKGADDVDETSSGGSELSFGDGNVQVVNARALNVELLGVDVGEVVTKTVMNLVSKFMTAQLEKLTEVAVNEDQCVETTTKVTKVDRFDEVNQVDEVDKDDGFSTMHLLAAAAVGSVVGTAATLALQCCRRRKKRSVACQSQTTFVRDVRKFQNLGRSLDQDVGQPYQ